MKTSFKKVIYLVLSLFIFYSLQSCQSELDKSVSEENTLETTSLIRTFDPTELAEMSSILDSEGITIQTDSTDAETRGIFLNNIFVKAIKVSCKSPSPKNDGTFVDMSGVLLVPKKIPLITDLTNFRLIVATPPTYTSNNDAPSNLFQRVSLISKDASLNMFYFFTLQAKAGYAVLIPDYLGYGDSFKQCIHPYIEQKTMVKSIINLINATKSTLSANGYRYKKEMIVTGYSQGGFLAAALTRELETNYAKTMPVNLLVTGGTPCNLKQIVDIIRKSDKLAHSYFIPMALWGFKSNGYPQVDVNSILREPYASMLRQIFNGYLTDPNDKFPAKVKNLYTQNFIENLDIDPNLAYINDILNENSLKPWTNKCKFVMTHGISDVSVYYQNAKDFAYQQNASGGKVTFHSTIGDHVTGIVPYYVIAASTFAAYR